jgi:hypothetical protein
MLVVRRPHGEVFFSFVESKSFELIIELGGISFRVQIVERGKGYLRSIFQEEIELFGCSWQSRPPWSKPSLAELFAIVVEAPSRMLSIAMVGGYLSRFQVDIQNIAPLEISHLFLHMIHFSCVMPIIVKSIIWVTFSCGLRLFQAWRLSFRNLY